MAAAVRVVPGRNAVSPPDLARDDPGADVLEPVLPGPVPGRRAELDAAVLDRGQGLLRHAGDVGEPLRRQHRFDRLAAPLRVADAVDVALGSDQASLGLQTLDDAPPRLEPVQAFEVRARLGRHSAVQADHPNARKVVPPGDLVVVRIVKGRHLDEPRAELRVDVLVRHQAKAPAEDRQPRETVRQVAVALVVRVESHRRVAQHRLGPRGRDDQRRLGIGCGAGAAFAHPRATLRRRSRRARFAC